jgi:hypothetical protein
MKTCGLAEGQRILRSPETLAQSIELQGLLCTGKWYLSKELQQITGYRLLTATHLLFLAAAARCAITVGFNSDGNIVFHFTVSPASAVVAGEKVQ